MKIDVRRTDGVAVVAMQGAIDGNTAPQAQEQVLPLLKDGCKLLIDLSRVDYMSSAGLRMMLVLYRWVAGCSGKIVLAGMSDDIRDTMELTGFLNFFATADNAEMGLAALAQ